LPTRYRLYIASTSLVGIGVLTGTPHYTALARHNRKGRSPGRFPYTSLVSTLAGELLTGLSRPRQHSPLLWQGRHIAGTASLTAALGNTLAGKAR